MSKLAVVLFNLGGPDRPESVRSFLFNLFNDPAIIRAPKPIRWCLARLISTRRAPVARQIYQHMGGKSPLFELTQGQGKALEEALVDLPDVKVFIAMRYWHPMSDEAAMAVQAWGAEEIVLLPLYPQYSTTTTASSIAAWRQAAERIGLEVPTRTLCCYPRFQGLIEAHAALIQRSLREGIEDTEASPRILFSAHGLPERVIAAGDPYQWQVEATAGAVAAALESRLLRELDWCVCYQSRVGPMRWIGPSTEDEIARAGRDGIPLVVVPIAFVSEHSETLVELDIEYRELAEQLGVPGYLRVPALGTDAGFIESLAELVRQARASESEEILSATSNRLCPGPYSDCPMTLRR